MIKIKECEFSFKCPKTWDNLEKVSEKLRHCTACDRDVILVKSNAEFDNMGKKGECVAVVGHIVTTLGMPMAAKRETQNNDRENVDDEYIYGTPSWLTDVEKHQK